MGKRNLKIIHIDADELSSVYDANGYKTNFKKMAKAGKTKKQQEWLDARKKKTISRLQKTNALKEWRKTLLKDQTKAFVFGEAKPSHKFQGLKAAMSKNSYDDPYNADDFEDMDDNEIYDLDFSELSRQELKDIIRGKKYPIKVFKSDTVEDIARKIKRHIEALEMFDDEPDDDNTNFVIPIKKAKPFKRLVPKRTTYGGYSILSNDEEDEIVEPEDEGNKAEYEFARKPEKESLKERTLTIEELREAKRIERIKEYVRCFEIYCVRPFMKKKDTFEIGVRNVANGFDCLFAYDKSFKDEEALKQLAEDIKESFRKHLMEKRSK